MWEALRKSGAVPIDANLYGAPKTLWKKFETEHWTNIYDLAPEVVKKSSPKASIAKRALMSEVSREDSLRWLNEIVGKTALQDGAAKEALNYFNRITSMTKPDVDGFIALARAVGKSLMIAEWSEFDRAEIDYHVEALDTYYPLLSMLRESSRYTARASDVDKITGYVHNCDRIEAIDSETKTADAA